MGVVRLIDAQGESETRPENPAQEPHLYLYGALYKFLERIAEAELERKGFKKVHFSDDSLPTSSGFFNQTVMEMDKTVLLREYENALKERRKSELRRRR